MKRIIAKGLRIILQPPAITHCKISKKSHICSGTQITSSSMERYSYIGHDCFVLKAEIGAFCSIADRCRIGGAMHPMERVSMSPVFHSGKNVLKTNFALFPATETKVIKIGADVWVGAGATVLSGITIGIGSVIGAGSVVTHDIPPYEIWAGNPARKIRDRFEPSVKDQLLASEWWMWDEDRIGHFSKLFSDPEAFVKVIAEQKEIFDGEKNENFAY